MSKTIPPTCPEPDVGSQYWRSLDQLADTPEFRQWVEREFPAGASEFNDPVSRRHFVKIMSASFLLAGFGLGGCRRPEEKILPFSKMPEGYVHGVPQFYATAMPNRGSAVPLVVKSNDGRPTKIEGNALHPDSNGGTDRFAQASILNLYDPDRAMRFAKGGDTAKREDALDFLGALSKKAQGNGGEGLCFLLERNSSPSRARLQKRIGDKFPKARWFLHEPVDFDIHRQAASLAFGKSVAPYFKFDEAKVIVSLDCDFIGSEQDAFINIRRFADGRKIDEPGGSMSRLYAVEALFTLTGANADHRLRLPAGQVLTFAAKLAAEVMKAQSAGGLGEVAGAVNKLASAFAGNEKWVVECAKDLAAHAGQALVVAGHGQPLAVHLIANALNAALGSAGKTVFLHNAPEGKEGTISELAQTLNAGQVDTLVILGSNPVYTAPTNLKWALTQRKARTVIRLGYHEDETFPVCDWHLPQTHYLESWGDARTADGTLVPVQPLIEPLFGGITELEVLAHIGGFENTKPYDIVRETFRGFAGDGEDNWKRFLHDGFLAGSAAQPVSVSFDGSNATRVIASAKPAEAPSKDKLELVFHRDYSVDDGRYNNNGWLQELPDPITKMVWENVVLMSLKTATDLGIEMISRNPSLTKAPQDNEDNKLRVPVVRIQLDGREIEGPAWVQPGMADHVIGLALGYGRQKTGRIGRGSGYDAYALRASDALHIASGATVSSTGRTHPLSSTQSHWAMEGRPIVREANLEQYRKHRDFAKKLDMEKPPLEESLYPNPFDQAKAQGLHQWGMTVDLNACVGCSACMMACQSENNVPIVGKYLVGRSREMHWIRIDRYYAGSIEDPQAVTQPMLCQHCEAAPCENVCPVNATVHDEEGLNVMAYNRCVGTRYCSNNCPYKVRRFNYLDYNRRPLDQLVGPFYPSPMTHKTDGEWDMVRWFKDRDKGTRPDDEWELLKLVKNPDVTVRMRGVMEKCTFCLQRIEQAKIAQKVRAGASGDVRLKESEGTIPRTACQQACPAGAIVFGDISDPESQVSKLKAQERNYTVLDFLLTKPRTTYLARVRNPNPAMPDYHEMPLTLEEYSKKNNIQGDPFAGHGGGDGGHDAGSGLEPKSGKGAH
jgi:molybdopterin-containing oxidoreductase family iron-sulfur binding subunit